jgi:hypothetical protein
MAEVRLATSRRRVWPWFLALLALAFLIWSAGEVLTSDTTSSAGLRPAGRQTTPGAAVSPASPHRPDPTPTRDPQREQALRIRSRVMA